MRKQLVVTTCALSLGVAACGDGETTRPVEGTGSLRAAVEVSADPHDVTAFELKVVGSEQDCAAEPLAVEIVEVEAEALPGSLAGAGQHAFGDGLFVLEPGSYRICATPLAGEGPSAECGPSDALAEVTPEVTTEVILYSQCESDGNGGLGAVVALNDRPEIEGLELDPSAFITICESVNLSVSASDPNGDELGYAWSIVSGPDGASLRANAAGATFSGPPGDYTLEVSVDDGHGGVTALAFPLHVSDASCEVPVEVQGIFDARCSPCHTTGSSGGLRLAPASASYANLVGANSSAAACSSRTRVVPGDVENSYLIAKLRGAAGICGLPMPRNLPALPEEEIATIEAWIAGLPH
jgi:hypothetical protein